MFPSHWWRYSALLSAGETHLVNKAPPARVVQPRLPPSLPPSRGARWLVLTVAHAQRAPGGCGRCCGTRGSSRVGASPGGSGQAGRSRGIGEGTPGAGKGRPVIAGSAVGEERGLSFGAGPQVCVRGSAAPGTGEGYEGCRCRVGAGAEELSRPCCSQGLRLWIALFRAWSCRGIDVFCSTFPRGDEGGGLRGLRVALAKCDAEGWVKGLRGSRPVPLLGAGHLRAQGRTIGALRDAPRGAVVAFAGRSALGDLCGLFSYVHQTPKRAVVLGTPRLRPVW